MPRSASLPCAVRRYLTNSPNDFWDDLAMAGNLVGRHGNRLAPRANPVADMPEAQLTQSSIKLGVGRDQGIGILGKSGG